jgi:hypothetical protein
MPRGSEAAAQPLHEVAEILEGGGERAQDASADALFFLRHRLWPLDLEQRLDLLGKLVALRRIAQRLEHVLQVFARRCGGTLVAGGRFRLRRRRLRAGMRNGHAERNSGQRRSEPSSQPPHHCHGNSPQTEGGRGDLSRPARASASQACSDKTRRQPPSHPTNQG